MHLPSPAELSPVELARIVDVALAEDLASGDVTTRAVIPAHALARGAFVSREPPRWRASGWPPTCSIASTRG
jgi:nicotinate-nucleotide pyrophosphorylase